MIDVDNGGNCDIICTCTTNSYVDDCMNHIYIDIIQISDVNSDY